MTQLDQSAPATAVDLFGPEVAADPYPVYRALRDLAPAVHVPAHDVWALTRYDDVRAASADWQTYSSASGVALLDDFNTPFLGTVLTSDPPRHTELRSVLSEQVSPRGIAKLRRQVAEAVDAIVAEAVTDDAFDGVTDLAQKVPVRLVGDLIGVPPEGRERLLPGADAVFTTFGPAGATLQERMPVFLDYVEWMQAAATREGLAPGSWGAAILDAVDDGRIEASGAVPLIHAFLVAGLDTTVNALASMLRVFAEQPHIWEVLKSDPALAGPVFEEVLRTESPVQVFSRVTTRSVRHGDVELPAGTRVLLHFAAANRDERHYPDPDRFDVRRNPVDHLAFGYGPHGCAGQALARLEGRCLIESLLSRVDSFVVDGTPVPHDNPVLRGLESLPLTIRRADG
ncbi:cytochrome P450 [Streptomyces sp. NBC_00457]|uniref:cytochrome P450 n=1 Tax=Streptomyces sp. NBC_00457 TaxID=2975748 RepID=UPI002E24FA90